MLNGPLRKGLPHLIRKFYRKFITWWFRAVYRAYIPIDNIKDLNRCSQLSNILDVWLSGKFANQWSSFLGAFLARSVSKILRKSVKRICHTIPSRVKNNTNALEIFSFVPTQLTLQIPTVSKMYLFDGVNRHTRLHCSRSISYFNFTSRYIDIYI